LSESPLEVFVQLAAPDPDTPDEDFIEQCVRHVLGDTPGEVVVRVVDEAESAMLNERYRGKHGSTNVLAFPAGDMPGPVPEPAPLGDIVIAAGVVAREAREQSKAPWAHWAHMIVHGCLHLMGYDHLVEDEAREMESRERELLAALGVADPYAAEA